MKRKGSTSESGKHVVQIKEPLPLRTRSQSLSPQHVLVKPDECKVVIIQYVDSNRKKQHKDAVVISYLMNKFLSIHTFCPETWKLLHPSQDYHDLTTQAIHQPQTKVVIKLMDRMFQQCGKCQDNANLAYNRKAREGIFKDFVIIPVRYDDFDEGFDYRLRHYWANK